MGSDPSAPPAEPSRDHLVREAWVASVGILVAFGILKHVGPVVPIVGAYVATIAAAIQLYVPLYLIGRWGITRQTLGLSFERWRRDLALVAILALVTTVPYAIGHHYWMTILYARAFEFRLPDDFVEKIAVQLLVVGLSEELFYRGYLQDRLQRIWPARRRLFGAPFGAAIIVSCAVFALAHFVGEYRFDRLGPFFPGLVFGLLRARTQTIVAAVGYHAYCNLLSDFLWASYRP
jgi:membrane protease YdiL (CAAX protease family)